jgi:hypothetical protein
MLPKSQVYRIAQLLAEGKSGCQVAKITGVGKATVQTIAKGEHFWQGGPSYYRDLGLTRLHPDVPAERCPGCGRKVRLPCRACLAETSAAEPLSGPDDEPLALDLPDDPETQRRYREVRRAAEARLGDGKRFAPDLE